MRFYFQRSTNLHDYKDCANKRGNTAVTGFSRLEIDVFTPNTVEKCGFALNSIFDLYSKHFIKPAEVVRLLVEPSRNLCCGDCIETFIFFYFKQGTCASVLAAHTIVQLYTN